MELKGSGNIMKMMSFAACVWNCSIVLQNTWWLCFDCISLQCQDPLLAFKHKCQRSHGDLLSSSSPHILISYKKLQHIVKEQVAMNWKIRKIQSHTSPIIGEWAYYLSFLWISHMKKYPWAYKWVFHLKACCIISKIRNSSL